MQGLREVQNISREAARPALLVDVRQVCVAAPPARAFTPIRRIGGSSGWYYANWLWSLRLVLDRLVGGAGRRQRRHPDQLKVGDVLDCWRVEAYEPGRRLRLALELRQPGRGWLEFEVTGNGASSTIRQTAEYDPCGPLGRIHWFLVSPLHNLMFPGMLRSIAAHCERNGHGTDHA